MATKKKSKRAATPRREDRPGHLDPAYAASLRALGGGRSASNDEAFVGEKRAKDDLAEEMAEEAVVAMTSGEDGLGDDLQAVVEEDRGGPFVTSTAERELAFDVDASNPKDAEAEPFPRT